MRNQVLSVISLLLASVVLLSYNDDPPNGRTGAPFDGHCRDCHSSNNPYNFNGLAEIVGLPDTVQPNTIYLLQLQVTATAGQPLKAGFQLIIVDKNGDNAGDFGDYPIAFTSTRYLAGGAAFLVSASTVSDVSCSGGQNGVVTVQTNGGTPPYYYLWSNGMTSQTMGALYAGTYSVTVTDNAACTSTGQAFVMTQDTIKPQLSCPPSQAVCAGDTVQYPLPTVLDNCDLNGEQPELLSGLPSGSVFPLGLTSQVFQVSDAWGNLANCAFSVRVWPAPSVSIDTVVHDMNNSGTGSIAVSIGGSSPFNYFWLKDGQAFPAVTEDLTGLHSGHYILQVVDSNGCSVLSETITVDNTVSTHIAPTSSASFRLMPNPVSTYFQIAYLAEPPVHLRLVQPNGEVVQEWSGQEVLERIRLDDIPAGIYFLKMETSKGYASVLRLVKVE